MIFYITPKLYKKNNFWRDMAFFITPKVSEFENLIRYFREGLGHIVDKQRYIAPSSPFLI